MRFKVSPESAIRCVKFFVSPILCWPPPLSAPKYNLIIRDVLLFMAALCPVNILVPLAMTTFDPQGNVTRATKSLSLLIAVSFAIFKMFMCRYHRAQFQIYFAELDEFIKAANPREKALLQCYLDRCAPLYGCVGVLALATAISFFCGPVILPQPLPMDADFPFSIEDSPKLIVCLFIVEIWVGLQAVAAVIVDIEIAMLLWFTGIRFELLAEDFRLAVSLPEFNRCIETHQKLLASVNEITHTVRYLVLAVTTVTTLGNLCTGYQLVHHQPTAVLAQFIFMLSVMSMEVLMYAWPADNLKNASENVAYAAYSSNWVGWSPGMLKSIQIVMLRSQRPLVISIAGLLPELNLDFYGKYLTTSFSYFTTLQAVVG